MAELSARLYLLTPPVEDATAFAPLLAAACAGGHVAALLLRLTPADERSLVSRVKMLAPAAQQAGTAVIVTTDADVDLATVAARAGADGVHVAGDLARVPELRDRLKGDRILGVGGLRSRHDAMSAGEAGADYLMFGEPRADGSLPDLSDVVERAAWWAEIFETPCVAYAPSLAGVAELTATGSEFVALGDAVWTDAHGPTAAVEAARRRLTGTESAA